MLQVFKLKIEANVDANVYLYPHAYIFMVVVGFILVDTIYMECKLYPCYSWYGSNIFSLVNAVMAYYHPNINTYIFGVNQALGMTDEDHIYIFSS